MFYFWKNKIAIKFEWTSTLFLFFLDFHCMVSTLLVCDYKGGSEANRIIRLFFVFQYTICIYLPFTHSSETLRSTRETAFRNERGREHSLTNVTFTVCYSQWYVHNMIIGGFSMFLFLCIYIYIWFLCVVIERWHRHLTTNLII